MSDNNGSDFVILDNSHLSVLKACSTMARYTYLDRRVRAGTAIARDAGKALHGALEARYKLDGSHDPSPATKAMMETMLVDAYTDLQLADDDYLTLGRMKQVVAAYNEGCRFEMGVGGKNGIYEHAGYRDEPFEVLAVEMPFAVELGTVECDSRTPQGCEEGVDPRFGYMPRVRVIYTGRTDLLVRWHDPERHVVIDHKKLSEWLPRTQMTWKVAAGPKGYAHCIPQYLREGIAHLPAEVQEALAPQEELREQLASQVKRVDGFCLNGAVVRREPESLSRVKLPPLQFVREFYYYTNSILAEWRTDALRWAKLWLDMRASGAWTLNDKSCSSFFGRPCPFYQVCQYPPEQRHLALASDEFKDNTWNPLTRDEVTAE